MADSGRQKIRWKYSCRPNTDLECERLKMKDIINGQDTMKERNANLFPQTQMMGNAR